MSWNLLINYMIEYALANSVTLIVMKYCNAMPTKTPYHVYLYFPANHI